MTDNLLLQFAIRPTIRNHATLTRDEVIKQVANAVGGRHSVDLINYDLCILIDIYKVRFTPDVFPGENLRHLRVANVREKQNICGMSVVGNDYEKLKRYNLAEIYRHSTKD